MTKGFGWDDVLKQVQQIGATVQSPFDQVRRQSLRDLAELTGRNVVVYYSGWLEKGQLARHGAQFHLHFGDVQGFMTTLHKLDRAKGLDILLHTPGGEVGALEATVNYLRSLFGTNIRAIVPQIAMSAGTMMALACREIILGKQSSLGPVDPQMPHGFSAFAPVAQFQQAAADIKRDPSLAAAWAPLLAKYPPGLLIDCIQAIKLTEELLTGWLQTGMFKGLPDAADRLAKTINELANPEVSKSHSRPLNYDRLAQLGINLARLEDNQSLQDAVLKAHHACIVTFSGTPAIKLIENDQGGSFIQQFNPVGSPKA